MIPISLIREFCSTDETRFILTQPRKIDGVIVATDMRVMIEVPSSEVEPLTDPPIDGEYPDHKPCLEAPFQHPPGEALPLPVVPPKPDPIKCDDCGGSGEIECYVFHREEVCETCEGTGSYIDFRKWIVETPDYYVGGQFMERILKLPNLRIFGPAEGLNTNPIRFTFGQSGRGALMQIRRKEEA